MSTYVLEQAIPIKALVLARAIGVTSLASVALTTTPPSSIVGAILWVGYLGNVVVTHLNLI